MFDLSTINYKLYNERDLEIPAIIDFVKTHPDIKTALDVGSHYSSHYYAEELKKMISNYDGVDILPDPETQSMIDNYIVGNVLDLKNRQYDLVFSISSIEHSGISTYKKTDYIEERMKVFAKILELSRKYVFLTFPFGKEALHENEFANITRDQLLEFGKQIKQWQGINNAKVEEEYYFSEAPQLKNPYRKVDAYFASNVEYVRELGTRCVCFMSIEKI